ncbi:hypothetical protein CPB83DRAFT_63063 [Crepidotus variabilis]|uniref:Uncharacterized protein n=1 Tax=Crepidotus variabilis TaxID=179855 RepID=A0A9P6E5R5_9AGAR|nr:hypothetical protein CPB83DRAFT_63063 [Crepidotus variabilis]
MSDKPVSLAVPVPKVANGDCRTNSFLLLLSLHRLLCFNPLSVMFSDKKAKKSSPKNLFKSVANKGAVLLDIEDMELEYLSEGDERDESSFSSSKKYFSKKKDESLMESWFWRVVDDGALSIQATLKRAAGPSISISLKRSAEAAICVLLLVKTVKENKANFHALALDAAGVVVQVYISYEKSEDKTKWPGKILEEELMDLLRLLTEIKEFAMARSEGGGVIRLFTKDHDSKRIKEFRKKIESSVRSIQRKALNFEQYLGLLKSKEEVAEVVPPEVKESQADLDKDREERDQLLAELLQEKRDREMEELKKQQRLDELERNKLKEEERKAKEAEKSIEQEIEQLEDAADEIKQIEEAEREKIKLEKLMKEVREREAQMKLQEEELNKRRRRMEEEERRLLDEKAVQKLRAKEAEFYASRKDRQEASDTEEIDERYDQPPSSDEEESSEEEDSESERLRLEEERKAQEKEARRAARRAAREAEERQLAEEEARQARKKKKKAQAPDQGFAPGQAYYPQGPYAPPPPQGHFYGPPPQHYPNAPYAPSPYYGSPAYPGSPMSPPGPWGQPPIAPPKGGTLTMNSGNVYSSVVSNVGNNYSQSGGSRKKTRTRT